MRTIIILLSLTVGRLFSQTSGRMDLCIVDGKTTKAIPGCVVNYFRNDSLISIFGTDLNGRVTVNFSGTSNNKRLEIIASGFESQNIKISSATKSPLTVKMLPVASLSDLQFQAPYCITSTVKSADKPREIIAIE